MRIIDVKQGTAHPVEGAGYAVDVAALVAESVVMVVWPDEGKPWIEREPFKGREDDAELIAVAEALMDEAQAKHDAPPPPPTLKDSKTAKRAAIETARKAAEREGVTIEGIRYAGDPSNRQALSEALDLAAITDQTHFSSWKDSDGQFHAAHPVADVHAALLAIGQRRGELIDREGVLSDQITAATDVETVEAIQW